MRATDNGQESGTMVHDPVKGDPFIPYGTVGLESENATAKIRQREAEQHDFSPRIPGQHKSEPLGHHLLAPLHVSIQQIGPIRRFLGIAEDYGSRVSREANGRSSKHTKSG